MNFKAPRGMHDILPDEVTRWHAMEEVAREQFRLFGYREIRTPIVEELELFERGTGETTDIVQKEMFVIEKKTRLALRPEGTPSVVRAYLQAHMDKKRQFQKLYYIGPMFRYERPQAGRQRQFHQLGVEAIGSDSPLLDAEVILLAGGILSGLGIAAGRLIVNSSGCQDCRPAYREVLHKALEPEIVGMCADCKTRYERNVLRILDCKKELCRNVVRTLPQIAAHLCETCTEHFAQVSASLDAAGTAYTVDPYLVRGLDYYTRTVFEIHHPSLGARGAICGGGRYDNLVETFGGPSVGCVGFSMGMEVLLLAQGEPDGNDGPAPDLFLVAVDAAARKRCFELAMGLRTEGYFAEIEYGDKSVKAQMRMASKMNSRFVAVVGEEEISTGRVTLRRMESGAEDEVAIDAIAEVLDA